MVNTVAPYSRRLDVLRVLLEHGALSSRGMREIIVPTISERALQYATKRLRDHKFIIRRMDYLPENVGYFFQLSQRKKYREQVSQLLGVTAESLWKPKIRNQELFHSEECAIWKHRLKQMFPNAQLIRDIDIPADPRMDRVLLPLKRKFRLLPDLILRLPKLNGNGDINVAIEIEKTRKSNRRLLIKFNKLASGTRLDGVIYINDNDALAETLRKVYCANTLKSAPRISHYGNNFMLFSNGQYATGATEPKMFNAALQNVSLREWIHFLVSTEDRGKLG